MDFSEISQRRPRASSERRLLYSRTATKQFHIPKLSQNLGIFNQRVQTPPSTSFHLDTPTSEMTTESPPTKLPQLLQPMHVDSSTPPESETTKPARAYRRYVSLMCDPERMKSWSFRFLILKVILFGVELALAQVQFDLLSESISYVTLSQIKFFFLVLSFLFYKLITKAKLLGFFGLYASLVIILVLSASQLATLEHSNYIYAQLGFIFMDITGGLYASLGGCSCKLEKRLLPEGVALTLNKFIKVFKKKKGGPNEFCVICFKTLNPKSKVVHLPCGGKKGAHIFHKECASGWLSQDPKCPVCLKPYPLP